MVGLIFLHGRDRCAVPFAVRILIQIMLANQRLLNLRHAFRINRLLSAHAFYCDGMLRFRVPGGISELAGSSSMPTALPARMHVRVLAAGGVMHACSHGRQRAKRCADYEGQTSTR